MSCVNIASTLLLGRLKKRGGKRGAKLQGADNRGLGILLDFAIVGIFRGTLAGDFLVLIFMCIRTK